jgi:hypothetical protein
LLVKTIPDLQSADAAKAELRALVHDLIGRREFHKDNEFPKMPDPKDLTKSWKALRDHLKDAFGAGFSWEPVPLKFNIGYVAARMDDLADTRRQTGLGTTLQFLGDLDSYLKSPHLVNAVLGALLCRWLLLKAEPLCRNVYSSKEMKLYEALLLDGELLLGCITNNIEWLMILRSYIGDTASR